MSKKIKKSISIFIIIILIVVAIISTFFIIRYFSEKNKINTVYETYSNENIQNNLESKDISNSQDLMLEINGEKVLGIKKLKKKALKVAYTKELL